jgi:hypothetical protein
MIKMTGATVTGEFSINGASSMNGTAAVCKAACDANIECGGFDRSASIADSSTGTCTWKSLVQTTPIMDELKTPYRLVSEKVIVDASKNLWRKQPRQTPFSGEDAPEIVRTADVSHEVYNQSDVPGYDIRREKLVNGRFLSSMRGTVDMCAATCTATPQCAAFTHTAGIDDDQIATCRLNSGSTNKDTPEGINAWLLDAFFKK